MLLSPHWSRTRHPPASASQKVRMMGLHHEAVSVFILGEKNLCSFSQETTSKGGAMFPGKDRKQKTQRLGIGIHMCPQSAGRASVSKPVHEQVE